MSTKDEALKLAEDALKRVRTQDMELVQLSMIALSAIREALAEQPARQEPLTDEQIEDIWADCPADWDDKINVLTLARAIEAAHGIKGDA